MIDRPSVAALPRLGCLILTACGVWSAGSAELAAQSRFDDLLRQIPPSANTLMVIDVEAVHRSPLAVREGWANQHEAEYVSRPMILPPESDRMVLASQLNPTQGFSQAWELGVMHLREPLSMRAIARAEGGYVDSINGQSAAWTPSDAYFVDLGNQMMGSMYPAHRQAVSRWVATGTQQSTPSISRYLQQAVAAVDRDTQIVLAFDLHDVPVPHRVREGLRELELTRDDAAKQRAWEPVILSLQGVTLKVSLGEAARGTLQVDFGGDVSVLGREAGDLVHRALENFGADIEELDQWKVRTTSSAVILEGTLSTTAMRRIFSLLELPSTKFSTLKDAEPAEEDDTRTVAEASQKYFRSVGALLDDLQKEFKTNSDARRSQAAVYMERYARNIDRLPILNVDEDLLNWGASVGETLRSASGTTRMAGIRTGVRKSQVYGNYQYAYDNNGYYYRRDRYTHLSDPITRWNFCTYHHY